MKPARSGYLANSALGFDFMLFVVKPALAMWGGVRLKRPLPIGWNGEVAKRVGARMTGIGYVCSTLPNHHIITRTADALASLMDA